VSVILTVGVVAQALTLALALARLTARGYSAYWMAMVVLTAAFIGGAFAGWPVLACVALALELVISAVHCLRLAGRIQR